MWCAQINLWYYHRSCFTPNATHFNFAQHNDILYSSFKLIHKHVTWLWTLILKRFGCTGAHRCRERESSEARTNVSIVAYRLISCDYNMSTRSHFGCIQVFIVANDCGVFAECHGESCSPGSRLGLMSPWLNVSVEDISGNGDSLMWVMSRPVYCIMMLQTTALNEWNTDAKRSRCLFPG